MQPHVKFEFDRGLEKHGERRVMVADGHDHATSLMAKRGGLSRWLTPSGKVVEEGGSYELETRMSLSPVRYDGTLKLLRFKPCDYIVSERLPGEHRIIEVASGAHYCEECHSDITGGESSTDWDTTMYVVTRLPDGVCSCCEAVVDAGVMLDSADETC